MGDKEPTPRLYGKQEAPPQRESMEGWSGGLLAPGLPLKVHVCMLTHARLLNPLICSFKCGNEPEF